MELSKTTILDVPLTLLSVEDFSRLCDSWLQGSEYHHIVTVNPEFLMEAQTNSGFRAVLQRAHLSLIDGFGLCLAILFFRGLCARRITGVQATYLCAERSAVHGARLYLLGGARGIAERAGRILQKKYPNLSIVGAEEGEPEKGGLWSEGDQSALLDRIRLSKPTILLVAFGAPKQELWINQWAQTVPSLKIAMGVGGTFDYITGVVPFAPAWMRACGLEWLFRLIVQPQRFRRIFTAIVRYPFAVIFHEFLHRS